MWYEARPQFVPFHERGERWGCIVAHRRAGKTVACVADLVMGALQETRPNPRFAYIAPLYKQAKDVAWQYLREFIAPVTGAKAHETELRVDLPNGARVRLYGADNPDALRGIYLDGVILDEYADMDPRMWSEVIRPALSDREGWAVFIGTPKGKNEFWKKWEQARAADDWFALLLRASETGILPAQELASAQAELSEDQYAQEYECSFEAAIQGAYYGALMAQADKEGRITRVPYDPAKQVETWWDLGVGDSTAIWFAQRVNAEIRVIDFYEMTGEGLPHYARILKEKPYVYSRHVAPHDIEVRELGSGKSRRETAKELGIAFDVAPKLDVDDGISAVRMLLPRCWFDAEKCAAGLECLRQYRKDWDERLKVFRPRPLHDWTSHAADAFRYGASMAEPVKKKPLVYPKGHISNHVV